MGKTASPNEPLNTVDLIAAFDNVIRIMPYRSSMPIMNKETYENLQRDLGKDFMKEFWGVDTELMDNATYKPSGKKLGSLFGIDIVESDGKDV